MKMPDCGLYLVTPDVADTAALIARVARVLPWAALLQYRNKCADDALRRRQAQALQLLCSAAGVPLIINDDVELACTVGAAGVHVGEDDSALGEARAMLGQDAIIGVSCYDSLTRAVSAAAEGASYVAFGAVFPSSTKPNARHADAALFTQAAALRVPRVAIGGIRERNARQAAAMGADLLAVISGVFEAVDPVAAARLIAAASGSAATGR